MKALALFTVVLVVSSCGDDCLTCVDMSAPSPITSEWCDDGSTNFTNQNGEIITYDEFIAALEAQGVECN